MVLETSCQFPRCVWAGGQELPTDVEPGTCHLLSPPLHCGMLDLEGLRCQMPDPLHTDPISTFHSSLVPLQARATQLPGSSQGAGLKAVRKHHHTLLIAAKGTDGIRSLHRKSITSQPHAVPRTARYRQDASPEYWSCLLQHLGVLLGLPAPCPDPFGSCSALFLCSPRALVLPWQLSPPVSSIHCRTDGFSHFGLCGWQGLRLFSYYHFIF